MDLAVRPIAQDVPPLMQRPIREEQELSVRPIKNDTEQLVAVSASDIQTRIGLTILDPKLFAKTFLQVDVWKIQADILDAITEDQARVAVKACHASSKTFSAATALLWFLARYTDEAVVVTTAPTWNQVEKLLWGEVHSALLRSRYPFPKPNLAELKIGPKRYAYGLSTAVTKQDEGVRFQGIHATNVLVIIDEAPGVNPKIYEAIEGARAGGNVRVLALGNPTIASGPFHSAFIDNRTGWKTFSIDAFETPNFEDIPGHMNLYDENTGEVTPGSKLDCLLNKMAPAELRDNKCPYLVTRLWVKEKFFEWGPGHPSWESRVRGRFPKQSQDALLSLAWLEEAKIRELEPLEADEVTAGIDVAGPGEDETSLTIRKGPRVLLHVQTGQSDPRGWLMAHLLPYKEILKNINVDAVGIGWNMYTHLRDTFKDRVTPVIVQQPSNDPEKFADLKSEFFWGFRQRCSTGDFCGLLDEATIGQLAGIRYKPTPRGQIAIESKEDARKRGVKSPDRAESVMLAFASRIMIFGALEHFKTLEKAFIQSKALSSAPKEDTKFACPVCQATCVVPNNGGLRCNQCGHQWGQKKRPDPVGGRTLLATRRG